MDKITVIFKSVYGTERIYPLNYKKELETLTGTKTLNGNQLRALRDLGFEIEQQRAYLGVTI